jgi:hypothetical protein
VPVGLVEAEHERPRDPVGVHQLEELVVVPDHAVDVVTEVKMGVEDVGSGRQELPELPVPLLDEFQRPGARFHGAHSR